MKSGNGNVVDFKAGSSESKTRMLERLFEEHSCALRRFLCVRLGVGQDLGDVVQEVYARLARLDGLQNKLDLNDSRKCRAFIFTAANNLVVDMERSRAVRQKYLDKERSRASVDDPPPGHSPELTALALQELELVKRVVVNMKSAWRKAFILNRFKYRTFPQIAVEMGVSPRTVEKYVKKAVIELRNAFVEISEAGKDG